MKKLVLIVAVSSLSAMNSLKQLAAKAVVKECIKSKSEFFTFITRADVPCDCKFDPIANALLHKKELFSRETPSNPREDERVMWLRSTTSLDSDDREFLILFLLQLHDAKNSVQSGFAALAIPEKSNQELLYSVALLSFVKKNNIRSLSLLLEHDADPNEYTDEHRRTCLHIAVRYNALDCCKLLLRYKENPNAEDSFGATPLHYAQSGPIAQSLLDYGADPNADHFKKRFASLAGLTPLDTAKKGSYAGVVEVLEKVQLKPFA